MENAFRSTMTTVFFPQDFLNPEDGSQCPLGRTTPISLVCVSLPHPPLLEVMGYGHPGLRWPLSAHLEIVGWGGGGYTEMQKLSRANLYLQEKPFALASLGTGLAGWGLGHLGGHRREHYRKH